MNKKSIKIKPFVYYYILLLFLEIIFKILIFGFKNIFNVNTIAILIFLITVASIFSIATNISKNKKLNNILNIVLTSIIIFWFSLEFIFKKIFNTFFCISLFGLTDQALTFGKTAILETIRNIYGPLIFLIPLILLIQLQKKNIIEKMHKSNLIITLIFLLTSIPLFLAFSYITRNNDLSTSYLINDVDNNALNLEKLGVNLTTVIDVKRTIFGFNEKINLEPADDESPEEKEQKYEYNIVDIDYEKIIADEKNSTLKTMHEYFNNDSGTQKNEYTGLYKDKNLIVVMAESLNNIAISETLTPTLYKLANSSFVFENFYTPVNLSTIGGEFQDLTGLFANLSTLNSNWRKGTNYFPYGLGTVFNELNYKTNAYHANYGTFQNRDVYLKTMGFDNFLYRGNGLEKLMNCNVWPQSDLDMINATTNMWINEDKFMTYYVSVSGHMPYSKSGNNMSKKNYDLVADLDLSSDAKGYLAANIELDKALEALIEKLSSANKLDDTVIAVIPDHYPYSLDLDTINELSDYKRDDVVEINHSTLIIWNNKTEKKNITKTASQLDFIPTLYNLFGINYDSRLFIGKDILSTEPGLAFFTNRSWISDYGTYFASTSNFIPKENVEIPENYITNMNKTVSNKINMSKLIIEKNYYAKVIEKK